MCNWIMNDRGAIAMYAPNEPEPKRLWISLIYKNNTNGILVPVPHSPKGMRANWYLGASLYLETIAILIYIPLVEHDVHSKDSIMDINQRLSMYHELRICSPTTKNLLILIPDKINNGVSLFFKVLNNICMRSRSGLLLV